MRRGDINIGTFNVHFSEPIRVVVRCFRSIRYFLPQYPILHALVGKQT